MKSFFKSFLAVILGNLVVAALFFFAGIVFLVFIIASLPIKSGVHIPDRAFLVLDMNMTVSDTPEQHDSGLGSLLNKDAPSMGLWDLTEALGAAGKDPKIKGLFITGSLISENYGSGFASLAELRRAILDFKKSGKPVIAYLDDPSLKNYYVATTADTLYVHPYADVGIAGLAAESFYLAGAMRRYGVGVQTTKVGKYKSAIEPFISEKMSDADREQQQALLNGRWTEIVADIAVGRKTTPAHIRQLSNEHGMLDARMARSEKLVDEVAYLDEVIEAVKALGDESGEHGSFIQIGVGDYALHRDKPNQDNLPVIAVVYAEGEIVDGQGDAQSVGGDALAATLRQIRQDPDVAAVVLRVNSPGGSAFASEVIQRETRQVSVSKKPLVVSMGSVAASGGYWISAYADKIFVERTTITGSIGVFGLLFNMQSIALNMGVSFDGVKTAKYADLETMSRPKTEDEMALLQRQTDKIYESFLNKVAEGRKLERRLVEEVAEGRVWTGVAARRLGLADEFGGLREAVAEAVSMGGVSGNYAVRQYPERRTALEALSLRLSQREDAPSIVRVLQRQGQNRGQAARASRHLARLWQHLERMNDRHGVYARLPYWDED
ncbi:MAG: signal peptide peptidase SppA [Puniceicoccales bacterium]|jgi:protease-4|nr:signal peptide peptidase SppA [Puniceicoccales bacterium]